MKCKCHFSSFLENLTLHGFFEIIALGFFHGESLKTSDAWKIPTLKGLIQGAWRNGGSVSQVSAFSPLRPSRVVVPLCVGFLYIRLANRGLIHVLHRAG